MRRWHVAALVAAAGVVLGGVASWRARTVRDALFERVERRLEGNAASTEAAIERWIEERRYDAATVAGEVAAHAAPFRAGRDGAIPAATRLIQRLRTGHGYLAVWVLDRDGHVVGGGPGIPAPEEVRAALTSLRSGRAQVCDPFRERGHLLLCYAASAAAAATESFHVDADHSDPFVVVLRTTPYGSLFPLLRSSALGDGSERGRLLSHVGDSLVVLASSSDRGEPSKLPAVRWSAAPGVLERAVSGGVAHGHYRTHDGRVIVAGARHVAGTSWAVVRQIDGTEIDRVVSAQLQREALLAGAVTLALVLGGALVARAERSRRVREIAASEARMVDTLRRSLDPVVAFDHAQRITFFNAAAERIYGWPAAEVIGQSLTVLTSTEGAARQSALVEAWMANPTSALEFGDAEPAVGMRRNGEVFPVEGMFTMGQHGGQRTFTLMIRDVTERRRHQAEREQSLSLLRATLESTADGILVVDREGRTRAYNRRFLDIWGIPEELANRGEDGAFLRFVMPQLRNPDEFRQRVAALYADPSVDGYDVVDLVDGRKIERVSRPQRLGDRIVGRVWSFRDVTARELAASALRRSEASARAFVEHSPYGICRVTVDGRFMSANPALLAMLGYSSEDALLRTEIGALFGDPAARATIVRHHEAGADTVRGEAIWRRVDGPEVPVRISSQLVRDSRGAPLHYVAYVENLAPLRSAEDALRQAEKLAAVGGFVSGVAHELNNPLAAVLLFAESLLEERALDHERETLHLLREQACRARAIVRDLLAFVRGGLDAATTVRADDVIAGAVRSLERQAAAADARLTLTVDGALGWIHVDRGGIEQVVTNLVVNALQAAPGGEVRVRASSTSRQLEIVVEDEGPGIPPDALRRIFEPFFTTKPVGVGTGLGLSVSLGIAERHGGTLRAENRDPAEGTGARLTLTLPLVAPPVAPHPAEPVDPAPIAIAPPARRVLVVDDEAAIRRALTRFFSRRGWGVEEAADGGEALARLLHGAAPPDTFDLVISDLRMPGVSGIELHDRLAAARPELLDRLVFSTGDLVSPEAAAFVARTGCAILEKPFQFATLEQLVDGLHTARPVATG